MEKLSSPCCVCWIGKGGSESLYFHNTKNNGISNDLGESIVPSIQTSVSMSFQRGSQIFADLSYLLLVVSKERRRK